MLGCAFFSFCTLNILCCSFLTCMESAVRWCLVGIPLYITLSLVVFRLLSSTSASFIMICLGMGLFGFILLWEPLDFPGGTVVKNLLANAGDAGSIPRSGRSTGVGNGNPFQYSCLENSLDRRAWWFTVHRVTKSPTQLSDWVHTYIMTEA